MPVIIFSYPCALVDWPYHACYYIFLFLCFSRVTLPFSFPIKPFYCWSPLSMPHVPHFGFWLSFSFILSWVPYHDWLCLISLLSNCTHPIYSHAFHWVVYDIHYILRSGSAIFFVLLDVILKCGSCCCCCFCWVWQQFEWNWIVFEYSNIRWFWFCV
jgi:hypothetical protein